MATAAIVVVGIPPVGADQELTVAAARDQLTAATAARERAEATVVRAEARRDDLAAKVASSSSESTAIAMAVAESSRSAHDQAVKAYVTGAVEAQFAVVLDAKGAIDASVGSDLLAHSAKTASNAAADLQRLRENNDPALVRLGEQLADAQRRLQIANSDLIQASALEADAERNVADATERERADRAAAAALQSATAKVATKATSTRPAAARPLVVVVSPPEAWLPDVTPGGPSPETWAKLRNCESRGNYRVVSASGKYRGAYQFDNRSWHGVGGSGDPAMAAPIEQDLRAAELFRAQGARAWPQCGRFLS